MNTLIHEVARRVLAGDDLDSISDEVIETRTDLSEEHKAAAWLYGWSLQLPHVQRAAARRMLGELA